MIPAWLVGIGAILSGVATVWTVFQQRQINKHNKRINHLEERHESS